MTRLVTTVFAAAALLLVPACKKPDATAPAQAADAAAAAPDTRATRVEVAELRPNTPRLDLRLPGEIEGARDSDVASTLGGYVERVFVKAGDTVQKGQSLAWINKSAQDAMLAQASAQLELARGDRDRTQAAGGSVSKARKDATEFQYRAAEGAYRLADIHARSAQNRAPFVGIVAKVMVEEGEVVAPGDTVARIVQLDPVRVSLTVSDRDVVSLRAGLPVRVTTEATADVFEGTLVRVSPAADTGSRAFEAEAEVPNPDRRLLPGMIARVLVSVEQKGDALTIPQDVLVTRKDSNGVFVERGGVAYWRDVKLGPVIRDQVVVLSGIEPGENVVVRGHRELADQDPVIVGRRGVCCTDGRVIFSPNEDKERASAP